MTPPAKNTNTRDSRLRVYFAAHCLYIACLIAAVLLSRQRSTAWKYTIILVAIIVFSYAVSIVLSFDHEAEDTMGDSADIAWHLLGQI